MKRLFQVQFPLGGARYFEDKGTAKIYRDEVNAAVGDAAQMHVTYGPDHRLFSTSPVPGRFKRHGGRVTSGIAKNKRHTHPERAARMANRRKAAV